jgi:hypothetical protein
MSVPCKEIPQSLLTGTKPNGHGPVRKSSANAASSGSGSGFAKDDALCVGRWAGARSLRYRDVELNSALHRVTSRRLPKSPDKHSPPRQSVI